MTEKLVEHSAGVTKEHRKDFVDRLSKAFLWQEEVASYLRRHGIECETPKNETLYPRGEQYDKIRKTFWDIKVFDGRFQIEVKAIGYKFTTEKNFPFNPIMIETCEGFDGRPVKPVAYVNVCKETRCAIWIPLSSRSAWTKARRVDQERQIESEYYMCPLSYAKSIGDLAERFRRIAGFNPGGVPASEYSIKEAM